MLFMKTNNILPDLLSLKTALDKNNTNQYINTRAHIIRNPNILLGLSGLRTASESSPSSSTATTSSSSPLLADTSRQDDISHLETVYHVHHQQQHCNFRFPTASWFLPQWTTSWWLEGRFFNFSRSVLTRYLRSCLTRYLRSTLTRYLRFCLTRYLRSILTRPDFVREL